MFLILSLSPSGRLSCEPDLHDDEHVARMEIDDSFAKQLLASFRASTASVLLQLGSAGNKFTLPLEFVFWRNWSQRFLKAIVQLDDEHFAEIEKFAKSGKTTIVSKAGSSVCLHRMN